MDKTGVMDRKPQSASLLAAPTENAALSSHILQAALPADDWSLLMQRGRAMTFRKGETIIARGSRGTSMYLILDGRVEVSITTADGHKAVLNQMGPGEVVGELALLDGGPRSADACAASAEVHLIAISQSQVFGILQGSSNVATALIRELCARVRNASEMFEVKSEKTASVRLARSLLHLAAKWGQAGAAGTLIPGFSQTELGDFAGLARENVNRQLKIWEDEDLIRRHAEGITIVDADRIADLAQL